MHERDWFGSMLQPHAIETTDEVRLALRQMAVDANRAVDEALNEFMLGSGTRRGGVWQPQSHPGDPADVIDFVAMAALEESAERHLPDHHVIWSGEDVRTTVSPVSTGSLLLSPDGCDGTSVARILRSCWSSAILAYEQVADAWEFCAAANAANGLVTTVDRFKGVYCGRMDLLPADDIRLHPDADRPAVHAMSSPASKVSGTRQLQDIAEWCNDRRRASGQPLWERLPNVGGSPFAAEVARGWVAVSLKLSHSFPWDVCDALFTAACGGYVVELEHGDYFGFEELIALFSTSPDTKVMPPFAASQFRPFVEEMLDAYEALMHTRPKMSVVGSPDPTH